MGNFKVKIINSEMLLTSFLLSGFLLQSGYTKIIQVGPEREYTVPSQAADVATDGDTVEIDAGEYIGDVAAWYQSNLVIMGVGGRAHLRADGNYRMGKGTWVMVGNNNTVENIEFSEASVPDENGAGIRLDGGGLTIRNCYFHDNENGILGGDGGGHVLIEYSEFSNNGFGDGYTHNIYISGADNFTLRFSYSHHAKIGHNVKTRAPVNYICYNRIMDENTGTSSYAIDVPDGGLTYIIGNLLQQGPDTDNSGAIVTYGAESLSNPSNHLYIINNTFVNDFPSGGTHIYTRSGTTAKIQNNIFARGGDILDGPGLLSQNWEVNDPNFVDIDNYDYHLTGKSIGAIDQGDDPGTGDNFNLTAVWQYVHPADRENRIITNQIDIGAYEYIPPTNIGNAKNKLLNKFSLKQNFPNPFNPLTYIVFELPSSQVVKIDIFNVRGQKVKRLVNQEFPIGIHTIDFDAAELKSGIYYYAISAGSYEETKKMILMR
jgi:hypothetical protein